MAARGKDGKGRFDNPLVDADGFRWWLEEDSKHWKRWL